VTGGKVTDGNGTGGSVISGTVTGGTVTGGTVTGTVVVRATTGLGRRVVVVIGTVVDVGAATATSLTVFGLAPLPTAKAATAIAARAAMEMAVMATVLRTA
jgi:hypothetical protein